MADNLVGYSRAGDVFHYRWAARRCLKLIYPNSEIEAIIVEGSREINKAGEYVIDVSEYYAAKEGDKRISYYQLKHTTVRKDEPLTLSDLRDSFIGFAERFSQHNGDPHKVTFTIITNRKIDDKLKQNIVSLANKCAVDGRFRSTIERYTKLNGDDLASFCALVGLEDGEGDYNVQKEELRVELSQLIAGSIDNEQIDSLIALVQEKAISRTNVEIKQEDVLKRFGITSKRDLYPAPTIMEELKNVVHREQYGSLRDSIVDSAGSVIVHAAGGVGKSVFCQQFIKSLPEGSIGIVYDCFGAGSYRNRSGSRHRHRDALTQIANELSSQGLCNPLILKDTTSEEDIMRRFLVLIGAAIASLRKTNPTAQLFILIDAADNAEMAAKEFNQSCFAHELLREKLPDGCKLVALCRTERIFLLDPPGNTAQIELSPFTALETTKNLRRSYPEATDDDGIEFHRLTSANPRVQANALDARCDTIRELLISLGPSGTTVERQIELQLNNAVSKMHESIPAEFRDGIDSICMGLASLPPHIPVDVLAKAANVDVEAIKSFISDIGRSLRLFDTSVQFIDEPTETWFRNKFLADAKSYETYISLLAPTASQSPYVAGVLPQLYLQAGHYDELIKMALSDDCLPENSPIDARNIRVQRLQFAFKAAIKAGNLQDAVKLAMRAGEEMAGNKRQLNLLHDNVDMIPLVQGKEKVQEIAFGRELRGSWDGSENIYSASLLSGIDEYRGEARNYLRSSANWLNLYYEGRKVGDAIDDELTEKDFLELVYSHLNILGVDGCLDFLSGFASGPFIFEVVRKLARRLIDLGRLDEVYEILHNSVRKPYYVIAITGELFSIGKIPDKEDIEVCLDLLCSSRDRIKNRGYSYDDPVRPAIISFLEVCLYQNLSPDKILRALRYYVPLRASRFVSESHFSNERALYLRTLAIRMALAGQVDVDMDKIVPKEFTAQKKKHIPNREADNFKEVLSGLVPWFLLRAHMLYNKDVDIQNAVRQANDISHKVSENRRYRDNDRLPYDIAEICSSILVLLGVVNQKDATNFYRAFLHSNKSFELPERIELLRATCRIPQLSEIRQDVESNCYEEISSLLGETPDETAGYYVSMARAVYVGSVDDARAYFDEAVEIVSKFGDEIVQRWDAVVSLAERACESGETTSELAYRFIRCAELVGEYVDREKYWDRDKALQICARMSPGIGLSAFSRWRDRHTGRFERQLERLLIELLTSDKITPAVGWALTRFFSQHQLDGILSLCLSKESSPKIRQFISYDAAHLLQIEGSDDCEVESYPAREECYERELQDEIKSQLEGVNVRDLWERVVLSTDANYYDVLNILSRLPKEWTNKISFKKEWPNIVFRLGQHYANDLTSGYVFDRFIEGLKLGRDLTEKLKSGIFSGLEKSGDPIDATHFFGFVKVACSSLSADAARDLVDYSLSRFEMHIEDDFGDGLWNDRLEVSDNINKNVAGFIWSALGSPRSTERWNAAHCVRMLAKLNCTEALDELVEWLTYDKVDAFGDRRFPFYNLHARLYLLIALARVSLEQPELLSKHCDVLLEYAFSKPHILIQKYTSEIATNVGKNAPKVKKRECECAVKNEDYYFGWDFEQYWYTPLGEVFGLSGNQIKDLAANVIINEWAVTNKGRYGDDPRVILWNRSANDTETGHSHGDYPRTDDLSFYQSYHAMLVIAAKLIEVMPVVKANDWCDDAWGEWLSRHTLTREDGKWLSDARDPLPRRRPEWIAAEKKDGWETDIKDEDFKECLMVDDEWLNVAGDWREKSNERTEIYSISSALVAKGTSDSLLRALSTCSDPYNYKLPHYKERGMEIDSGIFVLKGWINKHSSSRGLDAADPYANDIVYPPYSVGDDVAKCLRLRSCNDGRQWADESGTISLICETWSSHKQDRTEEPDQAGISLKARLSFLSSLCKSRDCDMIFEVSIKRDISYRYDRDDRRYNKPQHKIFILSADGRLKTTDADYRLG